MGRDRTIVLASASEARAALLRSAGVAVEVRPARVDEESVRAALLREGAAGREVADTLAELKATRRAFDTERIVVAADQVLVFDGAVLGKVSDRAAALERLRALRGRDHRLVTAACVAKGGSVIWRHIDVARLWMRSFSDGFLADFLERNEAAALRAVGCYELEGEGAQLFSRIEGDYFSILGLPLIPVLDILREHGALEK